MSNLTVNLQCVVMRNGIEIWLEQDKVTTLQNILEKITSSKFINFDNRTINTADITGIFSASDMESLTRRKNGEWLCQKGAWHSRGDKCQCLSQEAILKREEENKKNLELNKKRAEAIKKCKRGCDNGYMMGRFCQCIVNL